MTAPTTGYAPENAVVLLALATFSERPAAWQDSALCAQTDPEAFFPEKGGSPREAKRVCAGCGVRTECLDNALDNGEQFGVWGGLSEDERRPLRARPRRRRRSIPTTTAER
jgi:WhiB family redox-sensing transcriptional regulator